MNRVLEKVRRMIAILLAFVMLTFGGTFSSAMSMIAFATDDENTPEVALEDESIDADEAEAEEPVEEAAPEEPVQEEPAAEADADVPEEEKTDAEVSFEEGALSSSGKDYEVSLNYGADAKIPADAKLEVKEIKSSSKEYKKYIEEAAEKVSDKDTDADTLPYARFFDITILSADGNEIEPAAPVSVKIELGDKALATKDVDFAAVHFTEDSKDSVDVIPAEVNDKDLSFEAESFSVYGVVYYYTVDFYYTAKDGKASEYHMNGGSEMMMSDLFDKLSITKKTADITKVEFTDDSLLTFTKSGSDYNIKSLKAFKTSEVLTITFKDGEVIKIGVEDEDSSVSTWEALVAAVGDAEDGDTITVTADIEIPYDLDDPEKSTLVINGKKITIVGADGGVTIKRATLPKTGTPQSPETVYELEAMIKVESGTLTLGKNLTFSGDRGNRGSDALNYWFKNDFKQDPDDPTKGFFVQVGEGGALVLGETVGSDGPVFENYSSTWSQGNTRDNIPAGISPIFIAGDFTMNSGEIRDNVAGAVYGGPGVNAQNTSHYQGNSFLKYDNGNSTQMVGEPNVSNTTAENMLPKYTAGAIMFDAPGKTLVMNGGTLENNKAAGGAISVVGGKLTINDGTISKNFADHFGGGIFVASPDAEVRMCGGTVSENESPMGGGIFICRDGAFFLMGGSIDSNKGYGTGGGLLVYSDKVYLLSGTISNNTAATHGGGIYVYGADTEIQYQYTMVIYDAEITGNKALSDNGTITADGSSAIKGINLFAPNSTSGYWRKYHGSASTFMPGSGGGVWLCPAGITEFDASYLNIMENTAANQGDDFHKDAGFEGGVLVDFGPHDELAPNGNSWIHQELEGPWASAQHGAKYGQPFTYDEATSGDAGAIDVKNVGRIEHVENPPLRIVDNISVRGGGIGSDGSVFFTKDFSDKNIDKGELEYTKDFVHLDEQPMEYEMLLADENGDPVTNKDGDPVVIAYWRLFDSNYASNYGTYRTGVDYPEFGQFSAEWPGKENGDYSKIKILFPQGAGGYPFFNSDDPKLNVIIREYEVKSSDANAMKNLNQRRGAQVSERFFTYKIKEEVKKTVLLEKPITAYTGTNCDPTVQGCDNCDPGEGTTFMQRYRTFGFTADAENKEDIEIEKYVNQAVHSDIGVTDVFSYDILAYVAQDADEVVITDELGDLLEFAPEKGNVKVYDLGETTDDDGNRELIDSNHLPVYDVAGEEIDNGDITPSVKEGTEIDASTYTVNTDNNTLTLTITNKLDETADGFTNAKEDQFVTPLRGHYIRVHFDAQLSEDVRNKILSGEMSVDDLTYVTIDPEAEDADQDREEPKTGNEPVISDEEHTGIPNKASYNISVKNEAKYKDSSNTVTVKPEEPEIEKYVNQAVHDYIKLDEVFTYDVVAYVTNNADKVTISDKLVKDLEFANTDNIKIYDLGTENNHKPVNNVEGMKVNDDATVAVKGTDITTKAGVKVTAKDGQLTVVLDDGVNKKTGERTNTTVKDLRGHWVRVTFTAQIKKELQDKINAGEMNISELSSVTIKDNDPVISNEAHTGIDNKAGYKIETSNDGTYEDESNTVTVKPEKPEIEKFIDKVVHKDISVDKTFTYDVIAYVTGDADKVTITDPLVEDLEFVSTADAVKLVDLGKATANNVDHEPNGAAVTAEGKAITGGAVSKKIEGNTLTIVIDDAVTINKDNGTKTRKYETVKGLRGHWVKVTFEAKIESSKAKRIKNGELASDVLKYVTINDTTAENRDKPNVGNDPVKIDENHTGVKNTASYDIEINNTGEYKSEYKDTSNTVTVKPEEPEIEKYVNQAVHDYIKLEDVFTYDVIAYVTKDADKVVITDELDSQLQFESKEGDIKVVDLGTENNHKVTNDINAKKVNKDASVAEKGKAIKKNTVSIKGNKLTVTLDDAATVAGLRGHWVKVTFDAKIKDGLSTKDLKYTKIDAEAKEDRATPNVGNAPVVSDETHDGVPNKAAYTVGVKNDAGKIEDKHKDESNTVTVKPEEFDVEVSKQDLEGKELPGAKITITDEKGNVIDSWVSGDKPHKLRLKPGKYKLKEVVAPEGFNRVTTVIEFEVDEDGNVTVLTATVDNGGKIEVLDVNHLVLTDAPTPTISKKVNGSSETEISSPDEIFAYDITAKIAYVPEESFVIEDDVPSELEIVSPEDSSIKVNDEELSQEDVNKILTVDGNLMKVAPTLEMMKEWGPFEMTVTFYCKISDDADVSSGKSIKNVATLQVDGEYVPTSDNGDDEAYVRTEYEPEKSNPKDKKDKKSKVVKGANTGDSNWIPFLFLAFIAAAVLFEIIRRRRMN